MKRLGVVALLLMTGCLKTTPKAQEPRQPKTRVIEEAYDLSSGQFASFRVRLPSAGRIDAEIQVPSGPGINLYFMDDHNFNLYKNRKAFRYYTALSGQGLARAHRSATFNAGMYHVVTAAPKQRDDDDLIGVAVDVLEASQGNPMGLLRQLGKKPKTETSRVGARIRVTY